jgi:hypothetical protein
MTAGYAVSRQPLLPQNPAMTLPSTGNVNGARLQRRRTGPYVTLVRPERQRAYHRRAAGSDGVVVPAHYGQVLVREAQLDLKNA